MPSQSTSQICFLFDMQEFYSVAVVELMYTTVSGVVAVCVVGFFFIPHWGSIFFVFPMISMLYIDLLGKFSNDALDF